MQVNMGLQVRIIDAVVGAVVTSLFEYGISSLMFSNPLYMNPYLVGVICLFLFLFEGLSTSGVWDKLSPQIKGKFAFMRSRIDILKGLVLFVIVLLICILFIFPYIFPPFEITKPKDSSSVNVISTVSGHGAIPGSSVSIYVMDDLGQEWLQSTVGTTKDGRWECNSANFGQYGSGFTGKNFFIYATTLTRNNEIYETPHITVNRS